MSSKQFLIFLAKTKNTSLPTDYRVSKLPWHPYHEMIKQPRISTCVQITMKLILWNPPNHHLVDLQRTKLLKRINKKWFGIYLVVVRPCLILHKSKLHGHGGAFDCDGGLTWEIKFIDLGDGISSREFINYFSFVQGGSWFHWVSSRAFNLLIYSGMFQCAFKQLTRIHITTTFNALC